MYHVLIFNKKSIMEFNFDSASTATAFAEIAANYKADKDVKVVMAFEVNNERDTKIHDSDQSGD